MKLLYKKYNLLTLLSILIYSSSFAQITPQWSSFYGGNFHIDYFSLDMITDKTGNTYVLGYEQDTLSNLKGVIIKYNTNGIQQWVSTYNDIGIVGKITIDSLSNVYVISRYLGDFITIKFDSNGSYEWHQLYNGSANQTDDASEITIDDSLNVYVTGCSSELSSNSHDITTIKYNNHGVQQWVSHYHKGNNDTPNDIVFDNNQNIYITGFVIDSIMRCLVLKYDLNGNLIWSRIFNDGIFSNGQFIKYFNNSIIVGGTVRDSISNNDYLTLKYDTNSNLIWSSITNSQVNAAPNDEPKDMVVDKNGNVFLTGTQFVGNSINDDYFTIKLDSNGLLKWRKSYDGGVAFDDAFSLTLDDNGNVYVLGQSHDSFLQTVCLATLKYDSLGNLIWTAKYAPATHNVYVANTINLDSVGNVYVFGSVHNGNNPHLITLKYGLPTSLSNNYNIKNTFTFYPNPNNGIFNIETSVFDNTNITVFNATGKLVIQEKLSQPFTTINLSKHSKGLYFLKVETPSETIIEKIVYQ